MTTGFTIAAGLLVVVSVVLLLTIMVQKGRGSGAIFGPSNGNGVLGTKTPDALSWITSVLFVGFLVLTVWLNLAAR